MRRPCYGLAHGTSPAGRGLGIATPPRELHPDRHVRRSACPLPPGISPGFTLDIPTANLIDPTTEAVLLDGALNFAGSHNGGQLRVGPDGYLSAGIGDGGFD